jgi:RHS repeat-associated protein
VTLYKRGGIYWSYVFQEGVRHARSTKTGNRRFAEQIDQKHKEELLLRSTQLVDLKPQMKFTELAARFLADGDAKEWHRDRLKLLLPYFGEMAISRIGKAQVRQYALGNTTGFAYDSIGQLTSKTDARGGTTTYAYDAVGNLTTTTDALGHGMTLRYDAISRLTSIRDANGHTATSSYDALSRLVKIADPLGHQTQFAYDAVGNLLKITDANGNAASYTYDAVNNLVTVTDALHHVTKYSYDENNNRTAFINAKGNVTSYAYDPLNRLSAAIDPLSFATAYTYDGIGNVVAVKDANGNTNRFAYDALNRLTNISYGDGKTVTYSYDTNGNRTTMTDAHGTTGYAYDALNRLTSVVNPDGKTIKYQYNAVGRRQSLTYPDGKVMTYAYDPVNRLSQARDWLSGVTNYRYDPVGNLLSLVYPNETGISFAYDDANRLTRVTNSRVRSEDRDADGFHHFGVFEYMLDAVGNRLHVSNGHGNITRYSYDKLYQLTGVSTERSDDEDDHQDAGGRIVNYDYDAVGNRLRQSSGRHTINYLYDGADRLLKGGTVMYTYDGNGNQTSVTRAATGTPVIYSYDAANRLISVTSGAIRSSFSYDGDGNRINQSVSSGIFNYVNDIASAVPVVLQESGPDGDISYAYGLNVISESGNDFHDFYQYDGLGSVVGLTDFRGRLIQRYAYDAWGRTTDNLPEQDIGVRNKFRFTGEALDASTGLYYLRARYYEPSLGRFLSRDPLLGSPFFPLSQHRFEYALANPVRYRDPSGLFWIEISKTFLDVGNDFSQWYIQTFQPAEQQASDFNQCTLNIEQCPNIGQRQTQLNQSISRLGGETVKLGTDIVTKTLFDPATYGLSLPETLSQFQELFDLPKDLNGLQGSLKDLFAIPVARASGKIASHNKSW